MTNPPHRPRFQFHLSTAIVLMFTAGGLIWANSLERDPYSRAAGAIYRNNRGHIYRSAALGWPATAFKQSSETDITVTPNSIWSSENKVCYPCAFLDFSIALLILFFIWLACEYLFYWRTTPSGS